MQAILLSDKPAFLFKNYGQLFQTLPLGIGIISLLLLFSSDKYSKNTSELLFRWFKS